MIRFSLIILLLTSIGIYAQNNDAIGFNEKLTYKASYNMSGILTELAQVTLETSIVKTSKTTLLKLKGRATTYSQWDSFFKIRDVYETYVNPKSLKPYLHNRDINEGGYFKKMKYTFKHKSNTVKTVQTKKNNYVEDKTVKINPGTKDIISTFYSLRTFDLSSLNPGISKIFTILFDRKEIKGKVTYLGKETISTSIGKKSCYKLKVSAINSEKVNVILWFTADENKIPVYITFKIPVGNGELKLKSASGLRH